MEKVPWHVFDFVTLSRLCCLSKSYKQRAERELRNFDKDREVTTYLASLDSYSKQRIITGFSEEYLWNLLEFLKRKTGMKGRAEAEGEVFCIAPCCHDVCIESFMSCLHYTSMYLHSQSHIHIGNPLRIFGSAIFGGSLEEAITRAWNAFNYLACDIHHSHINLNKYVLWTGLNVKMCKLDFVQRNMYVTDVYDLSGLQGRLEVDVRGLEDTFQRRYDEYERLNGLSLCLYSLLDVA